MKETYFQVTTRWIERTMAVEDGSGVHVMVVPAGKNPLYARIVWEGDITPETLETYKEGYDFYVYTDHLPDFRKAELNYLKEINGF